MEYTNIVAILAIMVSLLIGGFAGAQLFPQEVVVEKPVVEYVDREIIVPQEVVKEVPVVDETKVNALESELSSLVERYEQLADEPYIANEVSKELSAIAKAKEDFLSDFMHQILRGHKMSEVSVDKWYDERVRIRDVTRVVDGQSIDYEQVTVWAELKAEYADSDGVDFERWEVKVEYDIDADGVEEPQVTVTLV